MIPGCEVGNRFINFLQIMLYLSLLITYDTENVGPNWCSCGWPCETWQAVIFWSNLTSPWPCWRSVPLWWDVQLTGCCPFSAEVIKQFKHSVCCGVSRESKFWSSLTVPQPLPRAMLGRAFRRGSDGVTARVCFNATMKGRISLL